MTPFWITAFLDFRAEHHDSGLEFWKAATAYDLSSARGDYDEFTTLLSHDGDPYLGVQRLSDGDDLARTKLLPMIRWPVGQAGSSRRLSTSNG